MTKCFHCHKDIPEADYSHLIKLVIEPVNFIENGQEIRYEVYKRGKLGKRRYSMENAPRVPVLFVLQVEP